MGSVEPKHCRARASSITIASGSSLVRVWPPEEVDAHGREGVRGHVHALDQVCARGLLRNKDIEIHTVLGGEDMVDLIGIDKGPGSLDVR